jgi:hypothetical protein
MRAGLRTRSKLGARLSGRTSDCAQR